MMRSHWWLLGGVLAVACSSAPPSSSPPGFRLTDASRTALLVLSPEKLPAPPPDKSNRFADDPTAAKFGQVLFFDTGFSGALLDEDNGQPNSLGNVGESGRVACAGCHIPTSGFVDSRSVRHTISLAAGWGARRAKPLLDVGQANGVIMWDGRHDALYNQPFQPIETAFEFNSSRLYAAEQIYARHRAKYEAIFGVIPIPLDDPMRFPQLTGATTGCRTLVANDYGITTGGKDCHGMPGDKAEYDGLAEPDKIEVTRIVVNMGKALGAYERLLSCGPSRFDAWMRGDEAALTESEKRGAALFVGQRADGSGAPACNGCHAGPYFSDQTFHNVGLSPGGVGPASSFFDKDDHGAKEGLALVLVDPLNVRGIYSDGDDGRLPAAVPPNMDGAFRTQSLRCVGKRPSFMHTGQMRSLEDVIAFFDRGGDKSGYPGSSENVSRGYSPDERADLAAFLRALDGPGPAPELLRAP